MQTVRKRTDLDQIIPYYQPIVSADTHTIFGYEVLGRKKQGTNVTSLGQFFHHPGISDEDKLAVDIHLQNLVFERLLLDDNKQHFFINVHSNYLIKENGAAFVKRLLDYEERGLNLKLLVLEMTEHSFTGDLNDLTDKLALLKSLGIKIALDDVGIGASNLDRVGILEPDILKVDIQALKHKEPTISYHGVMSSLSYLSRKIGADLLFEAIENKGELQYSWRNNGRFFQGYYLSLPQSELINENSFKKQFKQKIREFIQDEKTNLNSHFRLSMDLNFKLKQMINKIEPCENLDKTILKFASELEGLVCRLYITDEDGFQQTSNAVKTKRDWVLDRKYRGLNWSWRPYFLENIIRMEQENRGILSDAYSDIETGELIRTFSFPISKQLFLFIDIPVQET